MTIAPIGSMPATALAAAPAAGAVTPSGAAEQFDVMFCRMLLQSAPWTSGVAGGHGAQQAMFGDMVSDLLAQAAARQQQGFGTMLLTGIDQQGKGKT